MDIVIGQAKNFGMAAIIMIIALCGTTGILKFVKRFIKIREDFPKDPLAKELELRAICKFVLGLIIILGGICKITELTQYTGFTIVKCVFIILYGITLLIQGKYLLSRLRK